MRLHAGDVHVALEALQDDLLGGVAHQLAPDVAKVEEEGGVEAGGEAGDERGTSARHVEATVGDVDHGPAGAALPALGEAVQADDGRVVEVLEQVGVHAPEGEKSVEGGIGELRGGAVVGYQVGEEARVGVLRMGASRVEVREHLGGAWEKPRDGVDVGREDGSALYGRAWDDAGRVGVLGTAGAHEEAGHAVFLDDIDEAVEEGGVPRRGGVRGRGRGGTVDAGK